MRQGLQSPARDGRQREQVFLGYAERSGKLKPLSLSIYICIYTETYHCVAICSRESFGDRVLCFSPVAGSPDFCPPIAPCGVPLACHGCALAQLQQEPGTNVRLLFLALAPATVVGERIEEEQPKSAFSIGIVQATHLFDIHQL